MSFLEPVSPTPSRISVEAILVKMTEDSLFIKTDETAKPMWIPITGIQIKSKVRAKQVAPDENHMVILSMSERRAINTGLI